MEILEQKEQVKATCFCAMLCLATTNTLLDKVRLSLATTNKLLDKAMLSLATTNKLLDKKQRVR